MKILILLLLSFPVTLAAQKAVYIPQEWQSPGGLEYSLDRSLQSDNFIVFWGPLAGTDPTQAPAEIAFDAQAILDTAEDLYRFYIDTIRFVNDDNGGLISEYKIILVMLHTWPNLEGWAFGGNYDSTVGAMWMHPHAASSGPTLAHEFAHTLQNYTWMMNPGHGFIDSSYVGFFWETHAEFMALQRYPSIAREFDMARWLNTNQFHWSSTRHHYQAFIFLQFIKEREGIGMINRMWNESIIGEHPLQTYMRLTNIDQDALNHLFAEYAMRNVTWDYDIQDDLRIRMETLPRQFVSHETIIPELVNAEREWYKIPNYLAPQDYGYNGIRLYPEMQLNCDRQFVYVHLDEQTDLPGHNEMGILFGFVAVRADGEARYSEILSPGEHIFEVFPNDTALYLVVLGAPGQHHNYAYEIGFPKIYRQPYEFRVRNAKPEGFQPGYNLPPQGVSGASHPNGGGFVATSATVSPDAYVGPNALVLDNAQVLDNAVVDGYAIVKQSAIVRNNARVDSHAVIGEDAQISGDAQVTDRAHVFGGSTVYDSAKVAGSSLIFYTQAYDDATLGDNTFCWSANLHGDVRLGGDAEFFNECANGTYMQVDFAYNRFCDGLDDHPANEDINTSFWDAQLINMHTLVCDELLSSLWVEFTEVICVCDTFYYNGQPFTEDGYYTLEYPSTTGVDTLVTIQLYVYPTPVIITSLPRCQGDTAWIDGIPFIPGVPYDTFIHDPIFGCEVHVSGLIEAILVDTTVIVTDDLLEVQQPALLVEWFDCETNLSTGIFGKTFDPPADGYYKARIISLDTCEAFTSCHFVLGTATEHPDKFAWTLYPNPSSDQLIISVNESQAAGYRIALMNAVGQLVAIPAEPVYATRSFGIAHLPAGAYIVQLTAGDGTTSMKRFVRTD